ncbi:MAG: PepSY domain-containing protein [Planctomycetes bacterium]|nr:PepSY domain-containing protein [Planctomycetota bacterium]
MVTKMISLLGALALAAGLAVAPAPRGFAQENGEATGGETEAAKGEEAAGEAEEAAEDEADVRDLVGEAKVSLRDAIAAALKARPGAAVEAELEAEGAGTERKVFFEVKVLTKGKKSFDVRVNPATGKVISNEEDAEPDAQEEAAEFARVLEVARLSLAACVKKAEAIIKGTAVAAGLEMDGEDAVCTVGFVNERHVIEVALDVRAGNLVHVGLEDGGGEEEAGGDEEETDEKGEGKEAEEEKDHKEGKGGKEGKKGEGKEHGKGAKKTAGEGDEADDAAAAEEDAAPVEPKAPAAAGGPSVRPLADKVAFSPKVTHPYFPLSTVRYAVIQQGAEKMVRKVEEKTQKVGGVECLVLDEIEYDGKNLKEISRNFFAQDSDGNVYYFGEDVDMYTNGKVTSHGGAWKVGVNAKEPCLFMPADLKIGFQFKPENSPPDAEEFDEIERVDATLKVKAGSFEDVLVIRERDQATGPVKERKYYAKGVGLISENRTLNLVEYKKTEPAGENE